MKLFKNMTIFYDEKITRRQSNTFHFEEGPFSENVQGIGKYYHEVMLVTKLSQNKLQVKKVNTIQYDLY